MLAWRLPILVLILCFPLAVLASCGPTPSPTAQPTPAPSSSPTSSPTPAILSPSPRPTHSPRPTRTLLPTRTPTVPPSAWTPVPDDPYGPADYVALFMIGVGGERYLAYLTPAGNLKLVLRPDMEIACNTFYPPTSEGLVLCEDMYGPGGLAVIDLATTGVKKLAPPAGYSAFYAQISPDGRWVAFMEGLPQGYRLATWEVETGTVYTITSEVGPVGPWPAFWSSATGKVYWRLGQPATEGCCFGLWGAFPDGSEKEELLGREVEGLWHLSPDGSRVALLTYNADLGETIGSGEMGAGYNEIRLLDLPERKERLLWQGDPLCEVDLYGWLTDEVVVCGQECPAGDLFDREILTVDLAGRRAATLWSDRSASWGLSSLVSPNANWLLVNVGARSWWALDLHTGEERFVSYPIDPWDPIWCGGGEGLYSGRNSLLRLDLTTGQAFLLWEGQEFEFIQVIACR